MQHLLQEILSLLLNWRFFGVGGGAEMSGGAKWSVAKIWHVDENIVND